MKVLAISLFVVALAWPAIGLAQRHDPMLDDDGQTGDPKLDYKLRTSRAEADYTQLCANADEIVKIADEVLKSVGPNGVIDSSTTKSLARIRKLARQVRSQLGGSGDPTLNKTPETKPEVAEALLDRGKSLSDELKHSSRYEVNARLIMLSGEIVCLVDVLKQTAE